MTGRSIIFHTPPKVSNDSTSELSSICACHIHHATRLRLLFSLQFATPLRPVQAQTRKSPKSIPALTHSFAIPSARDISVKDIENNLMTSLGGSPPLDIVIRTSGVKRLSDFLLWQVGNPMFGTDTFPLLTKRIHTVLRRYPTAFFVDLLARFRTMGFRPHYTRLPAQSLVKVRSMIVTSSFVIVKSLSMILVSPTRVKPRQFLLLKMMDFGCGLLLKESFQRAICGSAVFSLHDEAVHERRVYPRMHLHPR